jgi:hypothetical protein
MRRLFLAVAATAAALCASTTARADSGFFGTSGIFVAPTADAQPRGALAIGANYVDASYRGGALDDSNGTVAQYVAVSILDNVEISMALINLEGKPGIQRLPLSNGMDGWNVDRSFSIHALVHRGFIGTPSFAVGARDIFGDAVQNRAVYAVAMQSLGPLRLTAGVGSQSLGGVFLGLQAPIGPRGQALAEMVNGSTNLGVRWQLWGGLQADLVLMDARSPAGGVSWRRRM